MPTLTPNYGFFLPLVNNVTDQDLWGGYLNSNWSSVDTILSTFEIVQSGKIDFFPFNAAPTGYLECAGSLVSRTTYAALWTAAQASGNIAANDGAWVKGQFSPGDGSTTFRIPDYRGYILRGWDDGAGVDSGRAIGSVQADALGPLTVTDPGHTHAVLSRSDSNVGFLAQVGGSLDSVFDFGTSGGRNFTVPSATTGITVAGTSSATETRVKNIAGMYCIKT